MFVWTIIQRVASEHDFEDYRDLVMCCSAIEHTDSMDICVVCGGDHVSVERRIRCTSSDCSGVRPCPVVWKVHQCTVTDIWVVHVNDASHGRGALPCSSEHRPRVTDELKRWLESEDEALIPPSMIEARLKAGVSKIREPLRKWPSKEQIVNAIKRIREQCGLRNTVQGITCFVGERVYRAGSEHEPEKAVVYASRRDANGLPYVAMGTDDDPFMLMVTSPQLIDNILRFADGTRFTIFHADATFKLSDVSYPVITCGITDSSRGYQLAALFVVSQRTQRDYAACFRALTEFIWERRGVQLQVSAVMGDADKAQLLGFKAVSAFSGAPPLMCFFHVLYNVRKHTTHFQTPLRVLIMTDILDMHFSVSLEEFVQQRDEIIRRWKQHPQLASFADYFAQQWLSEPFWRWQVFHTPAGYASTNNPCEVYNSSIKKYVRRRRNHMTRLLKKLCDLVERVSDTSDTEAFLKSFDKGIEVSKKVAKSKDAGVKADAEKKKAAKLYKQAVSWSLWRAHNRGMPEVGWVVDYGKATCECRYFAKFKVCAHLLIAQNRNDLDAIGKPRKIYNRSHRRLQQQDSQDAAQGGEQTDGSVQNQATLEQDQVQSILLSQWSRLDQSGLQPSWSPPFQEHQSPGRQHQWPQQYQWPQQHQQWPQQHQQWQQQHQWLHQYRSPPQQLIRHHPYSRPVQDQQNSASQDLEGRHDRWDWHRLCQPNVSHSQPRRGRHRLASSALNFE